jgi:hypothetical protein
VATAFFTAGFAFLAAAATFFAGALTAAAAFFAGAFTAATAFFTEGFAALLAGAFFAGAFVLFVDRTADLEVFMASRRFHAACRACAARVAVRWRPSSPVTVLHTLGQGATPGDDFRRRFRGRTRDGC